MGSAFGRPNRKRDNLDAPGDGVLPNDVLWEILLRLPADMLCRLRLVCRSLISDPTFTKAHSSCHPLVVGLYTIGGNNILPKREQPVEIHIIDLASGVIVKRIAVPGRSFDLSVQHGYVCVTVSRETSLVLNTVTAKATSLPMCILNDIVSPFILGFIPSGEYKVLQFRIFRCNDGGGYVQRCYAMTFNGGCCDSKWREKQHPVVPVEPNSGNMAVIGGVVYFLLNIHYVAYHEANADLEPDNIASFDLVTEESKPKRLRGPVSTILKGTGVKLSFFNQRRDFQLTELDGSLVVGHWRQQDYRFMDVWFMVDIDKGVWSRKYSIQCPPEWVYCKQFYPVMVLDDGRIVMWRDIEQVIRTYDPRTSTWATAMVTGEEYILLFVRFQETF